MAMKNKIKIAISTFVLRILTLLSTIACIVVIITNTFRFDGSKTTFKDVNAYRYVLATAVVGATYSLIQLPFAAYHAFVQKRLISGNLLPEFDFYGDKIVGFLLATGVGAGFAVTYEFKKFFKELFKTLANAGFAVSEEFKSKVDKFLDRVYIAAGLLLLAFLCMVVLSVLSSVQRKNKN